MLLLLQDDDDVGQSLLGTKTQYTAPLNVLNDLAQDKVCVSVINLQYIDQ